VKCFDNVDHLSAIAPGHCHVDTAKLAKPEQIAVIVWSICVDNLWRQRCFHPGRRHDWLWFIVPFPAVEIEHAEFGKLSCREIEVIAAGEVPLLVATPVFSDGSDPRQNVFVNELATDLPCGCS